LLGVTNPFFGKALKHWPHIVKLGDASLAGLQSVTGQAKSPSHNKVKPKFKLDSKPGVYSQVIFFFSFFNRNESQVRFFSHSSSKGMLC
jgi:hypothetical protein